MDWNTYAATQVSRYENGEGRLPSESDARQKQLVRMAMAAGGVGLARLMQGRPENASAWLIRSAERYRESFSPIGRYAGALAQLVLELDQEAAVTAGSLQREAPDAFPAAVADALAALAARDSSAYDVAIRGVLSSFEQREAYLEDAALADTVLVLQALAKPRAVAVTLSSPLLPP